MCVLCRDTFSRSDILKRHFQKCSIRRGNPTNASHLSHPQAHVKKNAMAQQKAFAAEHERMNGMGGMSADGMTPFGLIPNGTSEAVNNMSSNQHPLSRSNSMNRLDHAGRDERSLPAGVMDGHHGYSGMVPNGVSANLNSQHAAYNVPQNSNGMHLPMFGGSNTNAAWSPSMYPGA
jgi:hypothetical protein